MLKNDTRELATNVTTAYNQFCLASRSCGKWVHHTCNNQKKSGYLQKLFLKVCKMSHNFFSVEMV